MSVEAEAYVAVVSEELRISEQQQKRFREETKINGQFSVLLQMIRSGWPDSKKETPAEVQIFWDNRHLLSEVNRIIMRGMQVVAPHRLRREMLQRAHEGHQGVVKTKTRIREVLWWPGMSNEAEQLVSHCDVCARFAGRQTREPLQSTPLPEVPWEKVAVDLFELGGEHYLSIVDYYSRYPEVKELSNQRAGTVITALQEIFGRNGIPQTVISDNGPQFAGEEFAKFASRYQFKHTTSSPRYPQGNQSQNSQVSTAKG
eukprot:m.259637 g.259637  ORF g.259637 m.259637 type:complete len:258 (+) comp40426_c1_seq4:667-1440(+)